MSVDRDEVRRIAELAKLDLDDEEADRLTGEMNRILEHAERLRSLDADEGTAAPGDEGRVGSDADASETAGATPGAIDAASGPDPLMRPPDAFAPEMIEGFFAVPPPPGVVADEADREGPSDSREPSDAGGRDEGMG